MIVSAAAAVTAAFVMPRALFPPIVSKKSSPYQNNDGGSVELGEQDQFGASVVIPARRSG
jgi:hypothetical protein